MVVKKTESGPELKRLLTDLIDRHKAGSPTDQNVFWISLKPRNIAAMFEVGHQIHISNNAVKRLLKELGYGYRKPSKVLATGSYANRNEQFKIIFNMVLIISINSPVISID